MKGLHDDSKRQCFRLSVCANSLNKFFSTNFIRGFVAITQQQSGIEPGTPSLPSTALGRNNFRFWLIPII